MANQEWPTSRLLDLLEIDVPIIQAPMAGAQGSELAAAVSAAGGLGSLPCAMLTPDSAREEVAPHPERHQPRLRHELLLPRSRRRRIAAAEARWRKRLAGYYAELGVEPPAGGPAGARTVRRRILRAGRGSAAEGRQLSFRPAARRSVRARRGRSARRFSAPPRMSRGALAGGQGRRRDHRAGLRGGRASRHVPDRGRGGADRHLRAGPADRRCGRLPVIAAGGIADGRGIAAAFALGAAGVQIGTAYLRTPEATISELHRAALRSARDEDSALINVFTGRPPAGLINRFVRETGPINADAPAFPTAVGAITPLRTKAEAAGSSDFSPLWTGQAGPLTREMPAAALTATLADEALSVIHGLAAQR